MTETIGTYWIDRSNGEVMPPLLAVGIGQREDDGKVIIDLVAGAEKAQILFDLNYEPPTPNSKENQMRMVLELSGVLCQFNLYDARFFDLEGWQAMPIEDRQSAQLNLMLENADVVIGLFNQLPDMVRKKKP